MDEVGVRSANIGACSPVGRECLSGTQRVGQGTGLQHGRSGKGLDEVRLVGRGKAKGARGGLIGRQAVDLSSSPGTTHFLGSVSK